ncbi:MAG TPA: sensor histidine kinase, partial [Trebonia sp.]
PDGDGAVLEVSDAGPGMSKQDAARAFDRFHRGARVNGSANGHAPTASGDEEAVGSGLGLSIVQAIAAAHGGYARLWSVPGAGTTVQLRIPLRTQNHFSERQAALPPAPPVSSR